MEQISNFKLFVRWITIPYAALGILLALLVLAEWYVANVLI